MNTNIYYLSIKSTSLAHYIGKALICSSRIYEKRPSDIQTIENDYIILSKDKFLNDSNCSIELVLNSEEIDKYIKTIEDGLFLYSRPIPISRIQKVYFDNKMQSLKTVDIINRGVGFIPEKLVEVIDDKKKLISFQIDDKYQYDKKLEDKIKTYNQVLGGIAFVRNTYEGEFSKNYFSILSHFNTYIIKKYIDKKKIIRGYDGAFTHKGKIWNKLSPLIYKNISDSDVEQCAKEENISIQKSNGVFQYELVDKNSITYKLAILNIYGNSSTKRKKIEDLIYDCKRNKISKDKVEGISLIFGINNGYSAFYNQYDKKIVKFEMESLLDYYTIESVFQYVINDRKNNEKFEYIDKIFPDEELILDIEKEAFDIEEYSTNIFKYFTENILNISLQELLHNIINQFKNTFIEEINKKNSELENMKLEIKELNRELQNLKNSIEFKQSEKNNENTFDEEKERIIIEQALSDYDKYNSKKVPEIKKIAKEKGIKYTNKSNTIKSILTHKGNRLPI